MEWWLLCSNYEVSTNAIITFTSRGLFSESTKYTAGAALFVLCWEVGRSGIDWHNRLTNNEKEIEKWELSERWLASRSSTCQLLSLFILEIWLDRSSILAWARLAGWLDAERQRLFICAKWEVWCGESVTYLEMQFSLSAITRNFSQPGLRAQNNLILPTNNNWWSEISVNINSVLGRYM